MKKVMIFLCLMVFLSFGLLADGLFNGIKFETTLGAESFYAPVKMKDFDVFRYNVFITIGEGEDSFSYENVYKLSLNGINAIEKQNRIFAKFAMKGKYCDIYLKVGGSQLTEKILGNYKIRWQDEYIYDYLGKEYQDVCYNESIGPEISSQPYNTFFYGYGVNIYVINSKKIFLGLNGEFTTFHNKKFHLDFISSTEEQEELEEQTYIDQFIVAFNDIENKMLKTGVQLSIIG